MMYAFSATTIWDFTMDTNVSFTGEHEDQANQTNTIPALVLLLIVAVLIGWMVS